MNKVLVFSVALPFSVFVLTGCLPANFKPNPTPKQGAESELTLPQAESKVSQAESDAGAVDAALSEMDSAVDQADQEISDDLSDQNLGLE